MTNHTTVAHRWAQNNKPGANLKGYAMFCAGGRIYSHGHHFVIARFTSTPERRGKPSREVVLFNADGYSSSTAKHKTYVRRAIPSRYEVFEVPDLKDNADYSLGIYGRPVIDWHLKQAIDLYLQASRARTRSGWLREQAEGHLGKAEAFAEAFGLKFKRPASMDALVAQAAKEAASRAKAEAKARKVREEAERVRAAAQRENDAERFAAWQAGKTRHCPSSYRVSDNGGAYVTRYRDDLTDDLITSQGAVVPWEHALRAFRFIKRCVERGEAFHTNGRVIRVGHYTVDSIATNGDMVAGCHRFAWADMQALAVREGVANMSSSLDAIETREATRA